MEVRQGALLQQRERERKQPDKVPGRGNGKCSSPPLKCDYHRSIHFCHAFKKAKHCVAENAHLRAQSITPAHPTPPTLGTEEGPR